MKKRLLLAVLLLAGATTWLSGQEAEPETVVPNWSFGAGLGFDFSQLLQINPKQGAGQNRLGFGTAVNIFAKHAHDRLAWDNTGVWQFGIQRLGSGVLSTDEKIPFQKAIDEFRFSSKLGYKTSPNSKFFYSADMNFVSQLTPTYQGTDDYPGNFLSDITADGSALLQSRLFSPATMTLSAGIDFKPTSQFSLYYSPIGSKFIIVADDAIAALGVHGNPVERDANGNVIDFDNVDAQLGSLLKANFSGKFWQDRMAFGSTLLLFSNYLRNPQNIDVDWNNELAVALFEGLQLSLTLNIFYDDDVRVQITDWNAPNGVSGVGKRVSLTQQLLIKYNLTF